MDSRIAVTSRTFGSQFQGLVYAQLRRLLPPGTAIEELLIPESEPDAATTHPRLMKLLDGPSRPAVVVSLCLVPGLETVAAFAQVGVPIIIVDYEVAGASLVASDNARGGYLAARHLLERGRRALGFICGGPRARKDYNAELRLRGFQDGLREAGVALAPASIADAPEYSRKDGADAAAKLLQPGSKIDGLFCAAGDACAIGFLAEARKRGVKVPEQLAVIGYDDSPLSGICDPPLTTIRQPIEVMAQEVLRLATSSPAALIAKPARVFLEPKLVVRSST